MPILSIEDQQDGRTAAVQPEDKSKGLPRLHPLEKFEKAPYAPIRLRFSPGVAMVQSMTERIEINPRVCGGQPVVKGTRIPVAVILEQLAEGESWDSLLRGYPELTRADIKGILEYARHAVLHTEMTIMDAA